jgi:tetratricopeptide (TPR) repeat protein
VIAHKAMAKNPGDRYPSAAALADDLRRWLDDLPIMARPPTLRQRVARWGRRHPALVAALLVATLAGLVAAGVAASWRERLRGREQARVAVLEERGGSALAEAEKHIQQRRLDAARQAMARAEGLEEGGAGEALRQRADRIRRDLDFLTALEAISLKLAGTSAVASDFDEEGLSQLRDALRRYGLEPGRPPDETAAWLRAGGLADEVLGALERLGNLLRTKRGADVERERTWVQQVLQSAARSEPELLQRWYRALARLDRGALTELARQLDVERLSAMRVVRLAYQLQVVAGAWPSAELLRRARRHRAGDFWINHFLGLALLRAQPPDVVGGIRALDAAVALRPDSAGAWVNLSNALRMAGRLAESLDAARQALSLQPDNPSARLTVGVSLAASGREGEAEKEYLQVLRLRPGFAEAHHNLGLILLARKQYPEAEAAHRMALQCRREYPEAERSLGQALMGQKKYTAAEAAFRRAIVLQPDDAVAHAGLGQALIARHQFAAARQPLEKALRLQPDFPRAEAFLSLCLSIQGQSRRGEEICRRLLAARPGDLDARFGLGVALLAQRKYPQAEKVLEEALRANPDAEQVCKLLVDTLLVQQKYARAAEVGQRLVVLLPDAASYTALGKALHSLNKPVEAEKAFARALEQEPDHAEALCLLGLSLRNQARFDEALKALRRGHALGSRLRGWNQPSGRWLRDVERTVEMERRLAEVLAGKRKTSGPKETADYAAFCGMTTRFTACARLYADAFAGDPKLAEGFRFLAANAAIQAAAGQGRDAAGLSEAERTRWRRQALAWLQAELKALAKRPAAPRKQTLKQWLGDPDLASVRDGKEVARLPADEREGWQKLWGEVRRLSSSAPARREHP